MMATRRSVAALISVAVVSGCASRPPVPALVVPEVSAASRTVSPAVGELRQDLTRLFSHPTLEHSILGVLVRSLDRDEDLYSLNPRTLLDPASAAKIVTLAAAVDRLGWSYQYETQLLSSAPIDRGVLRGNLFARGTGDPTINAPDSDEALFSMWAAELRATGIRKIDGQIVGDDNALTECGAIDAFAGVGPGWAWDDLALSFATSSGALQHRENVTTVVIEPGPRIGSRATVHLDSSSGLELVNRVLTSNEDTEFIVTIRRLPGQSRLVINGSIPTSSSAVSRLVSVNNPTIFFVKALRQALIHNGISVTGNAVDIDDLPPQTLLASQHTPRVLAVHRSKPLSEIAVDMMKRSQNLYAESIFRTLSLEASEKPALGSLAIIANLLKSWGLENDQFHIADGSGLSPYTLLTAEVLVTVLDRMHSNPINQMNFEQTLPLAGHDGTLTTRMRGTPAEGNARAKTGTKTHARALAGYVWTQDGEQLAFAILANNFQVPAKEIIRVIDAAVSRLAKFRRRY